MPLASKYMCLAFARNIINFYELNNFNYHNIQFKKSLQFQRGIPYLLSYEDANGHVTVLAQPPSNGPLTTMHLNINHSHLYNTVVPKTKKQMVN